MTRRAPAVTADLGRLVGLVGPGAWALYGAYAATYITLAALTRLPSPPSASDLVALASVLGAGALIASPSATPLSRWRLACVLAAVAASTTAGALSLPHEGIPALEAWFLGANSFLLFATALRARIIGAWAGMAIMVAIVLGWSTLATGDGWQGLAIVHGQPVSLLAGTFFSLGLHTTARRIATFQAAEQRAAAAEAHTAEATRHRSAQLDALRTASVPTLDAIAERRLSAADRRAVEILEATLRDRIRGRALTEEPLSSAVRRLRERGADVLLLDDLGDGERPEDALHPLRVWAAAQLDLVGDAETTVRITREGDERVITITADGVDVQHQG